MAEVMEGVKHEVPSKGKVNGALTTGIIGTSLSGLLTLGALGIGSGILVKVRIVKVFLTESFIMKEKRLLIILN